SRSIVVFVFEYPLRYLCILTLTLNVLIFLVRCSVHIRDIHSFPTRRSSDLIIFLFLVDILSILKEDKNDSKYHFYFRSVNSRWRSEEHTSELQSRFDLLCRLLLEKKKLN